MNEKLIADLLAKGCTSNKQAAIYAQVYLELCEVKRYWDVKYFYNEQVNTVCITGKKTKNATECYFLPWAVSDSIEFAKIQELAGISKDSSHVVYLVFVNADSTTVYYEINNGLEAPTAYRSARKVKDNKQEQLDVELRRNYSLLQQAAMYNLPITIPRQALTQSNVELDDHPEKS